MVNSITKEQIAGLPVAKFEGRIVIIQTEAEAQSAIDYLSAFDKVGFDTETRPTFKKGRSHKIALMQLSTEDTCFLFRLNLIGFPDCLLQFLSNPEIKKIGLSLKDDFSAIHKRSELEPQGFVELQAFVKQYEIEDIGLQRVYAIIFGKKISKRQRLTNWETTVLSDAQKMYAALDAWACLKIYNELINRSLKADKD